VLLALSVPSEGWRLEIDKAGDARAVVRDDLQLVDGKV